MNSQISQHSFWFLCQFYHILGLYEVGVHIADVSYFIEEGTALDKKAGERATSVYLVQRVSSLTTVAFEILAVRA